ncbi:MAG: hypothetical protein EOO27_31465 [Comamonadaceae bacterium]|nr:MAG: hypothetical protein EOO27_31465 [Comamonadaceae bacterium]
MRRYLKVDDSYLLPDRTVAFVDNGVRIRVHTENKEVMRSVVAIAQQRGWRSIEVRGSEAFRRGMWREAGLQGIDATGYVPNEAETYQLARALGRQAQSTEGRAVALNIRPAPEPPLGGVNAGQAQQSPHSEQPDGSSGRAGPGSAPNRSNTRPPIVGTLVAAAAAPFKFDPDQPMSYYVTVRTVRGDRTVWGTDLERALAESQSQPNVGSVVALLQHGAKDINVSVPERNESGDLVRDRKIAAQRNQWRLETVEHLHDVQRAAEMVRNGTPPPQSALEVVPTLATAAAGMKLAQEYARRVTADPASQQRLLDAIRDRLASAVERGQDIHLPGTRDRTSQERVPHRQRGGRTREQRIHERT